MIPVVIIEGPTASGKSQIALEIADMFATGIISADSRQVYKGLDIGTAKPSLKEREKTPHHLIDIILPDQEYSAGKFTEDSMAIINELWNKKKIPIVSGGTGFYIKAMLEGLFETPQVAQSIRYELDQLESDKGQEYLYELLTKIDPDSAGRIHPNDIYRIKRALEIWISSGKSISKHWQEQKRTNPSLNPFRVMVYEERTVLYEKIGQRLEKMLENGLIDEIKRLLGSGYKQSDPGMKSVGYKEFIPYINGQSSFIDCVEAAKKNTRNYAKRQFTWYRRIKFNHYTAIGEFNPATLADRIKKSFAQVF